MGQADLTKELAALRAKRKPAPTEAEAAALAEEERLRAEIAAELRALRLDENEAIVAKHAPTKARRFFDFDPDGEQPAEIMHDGKACALYTRIVVCGANADQLEQHGDGIKVTLGADGKPSVVVDSAKQIAVANDIAVACVVYPTAESAGVSPEQHARNVRASLWYLGAARATVGQAAIELGGVAAAAHRSKS